MKVYLSNHEIPGWMETVSSYRLHYEEPAWSRGRWSSPREIAVCEMAVHAVFGDQKPAPGELLELELRPGTTWVWK